MIPEEILLAKEVTDQLIEDFNDCCHEAKRRLSGQLENQHVANATLVVLVGALLGYAHPFRGLMIDHIIDELNLLRAQP